MLIDTLQQEYCPPIDTATFYAIVLDFDLESSAGLADARNTLDAIKLSAEAEEATGFDASGSAHESPRSHPSSSHHESAESVTSLSTSSVFEREIEALSFEDKQALLAETFPDLALFTVTHALKGCRGNFEAAVEELLTTAFLEEGHSEGEYQIPKSIDGFVQSTKKRGKRKQRSNLSSSTPGSADLPLNKWEKAEREIEYIAQRTTISRSAVSSCYHLNGASLSRSIVALSKETALPALSDAASLMADFPTVDAEVLAGIVRLTHPSAAAAHELALATLKSPFPAPSSDTSILPQYAKLKIDEPGAERLPVRPARDAAAAARTYAAARQQAFEQASAAYKRSRSDRLMGGVAGYYASVGRDASALAEGYAADAADALVARQSTATRIDLHGVDVKNAVRIALASTERWWAGAAEYARQGTGQFSIVTGVGRHSQAGRARIGPAVRKALAGDGWRVEDAGGVLVVRGKVRR